MSRNMSILVKTLLSLLWLALVVWAGLCGLLFALFVGVYAIPLAAATLSGVLAGICLLLWLLFRKRRVGRGFGTAAGVLLGLALLVSLGTAAYDRFVVNRYEAVRESKWWWNDYHPFKPNNRLAKVEPDATFRFVGKAPRISGAYALYPVYAAAFQALVSVPLDDGGLGLEWFLDLEGSDEIFARLNEPEDQKNKPVDLIFGLWPSTEQVAAMREAKLRYTLTPVLREAFVFFVHKDNPVSSLTQDQIRAIYSGRVTKWRELGVPLDAPLRPWQRNKDSGSQTRFERFMADTPIMNPKTELVSHSMGGVIERVADYRNSPGALGFSFRFFVTELIKNPNIKLLAIDGVQPTVANIQSGTYPLITEAYAITARPREGNVAKMIAFFRSPEGRRLVEASGYVPVPEGSVDLVLE